MTRKEYEDFYKKTDWEKEIDKIQCEQNAFKSNRDKYLDEVKKMKCLMYDPCTLCYKCLNAAPHLYEQCDKCKVPFCHHSQEERAIMHNVENFTNKISKDSILYENRLNTGLCKKDNV